VDGKHVVRDINAIFDDIIRPCQESEAMIGARWDSGMEQLLHTMSIDGYGQVWRMVCLHGARIEASQSQSIGHAGMP